MHCPLLFSLTHSGGLKDPEALVGKGADLLPREGGPSVRKSSPGSGGVATEAGQLPRSPEAPTSPGGSGGPRLLGVKTEVLSGRI